MSYCIGFDIGGTKCAVIKGDKTGKIVDKIVFPTTDFPSTYSKIFQTLQSLQPFDAVGISCGGPLNEEQGVILSPPNLPDWNDVHIIDDVIKQLDKRFNSIEKVLDTLVLSESTAIGSMARRLAFRELGINKYQFFTRADERTCEVCGGMHGLTFPISAFEVGVTASPLHPRCRCWEIPIMD